MNGLASSYSGFRWVALVGLVLTKAISAEASDPARAARSVHLWWDAPEGTIFSQELIVEESTPGSYFMACGWNTGYFGIQELGDRRKVVLFSVWDPTKGDNPDAVPLEQRVEVLHQHPAARVRRFGGEGTGGQCMMDLAWELGQTNRFLLAATVKDQKTAYAGYLLPPGQKDWIHLVTFRTRTGGQNLKGYYSFIEDFRRDRQSVKEIRQARFGAGWVRTLDDRWIALTRARFTASNAEWESRDNINAEVNGNAFLLATGGGTTRSTPVGSSLSRPPPGLGLPEGFD